jgi:hypothetical protein
MKKKESKAKGSKARAKKVALRDLKSRKPETVKGGGIGTSPGVKAGYTNRNTDFTEKF